MEKSLLYAKDRHHRGLRADSLRVSSQFECGIHIWLSVLLKQHSSGTMLYYDTVDLLDECLEWRKMIILFMFEFKSFISNMFWKIESDLLLYRVVGWWSGSVMQAKIMTQNELIRSIKLGHDRIWFKTQLKWPDQFSFRSWSNKKMLKSEKYFIDSERFFKNSVKNYIL